jgi:hypothetical protein
MKLTVADITFAHAVISREGGISLPPAAGLKLARITRAIRQEAESAQAAQDALIPQHIERDAEGKPIKVTLPDGTTDDRLAEGGRPFRAAVRLLRAQEIEINLPALTLAELGDKPLSSDWLDALAPFLA